MGHAHHFLRRLDRVSLPHVELALRLYNDSGLVHYILKASPLPDGAERVAISLSHPEEGPFIIVTRTGHFVTCLGEGMNAGHTPVITRHQLDVLAKRITELRICIEECDRLGSAGVNKIFQRIHEAGDTLSREEMSTFAGLAPLYRTEFLKRFLHASSDVVQCRKIFARELKRARRLKPIFGESLRGFHEAYWSVGHFAVLAGVNGRTTLDELSESGMERVDRLSLSWLAVCQGDIPLALKGIWAVARIGRPLLPGIKRRFREAMAGIDYLDSAMSLAAIGFRYPRLHEEMREELAVGPAMPDTTREGQVVHQIHKELMAVYDGDNEATAREHAELGTSTWKQAIMQNPKALARLPASKPTRALGGGSEDVATSALSLRDDPSPTQEEEESGTLQKLSLDAIDTEIARCIAVNTQTDFLMAAKKTTQMFKALPWVARATPEMLYLPRAVLRVVRKPWDPEETVHSLRAHRSIYLGTAEQPTGPARQGPCPCGSGKKYKRCCAAEAA